MQNNGLKSVFSDLNKRHSCANRRENIHPSAGRHLRHDDGISAAYECCRPSLPDRTSSCKYSSCILQTTTQVGCSLRRYCCIRIDVDSHVEYVVRHRRPEFNLTIAVVSWAGWALGVPIVVGLDYSSSGYSFTIERAGRTVGGGRPTLTRTAGATS